MLMNGLSIIVRYSRIFSERKLAEQDIGFPEQILLMYLSSVAQINQETISQHFMIDKGAVAKTVSKLEEKELILRLQNPENKRENLISISPKGYEILGIMKKVLEDWNNCLYEGISREEIEQYNCITAKMVSNVSKLKNWSEQHDRHH